ncbi:hypothetical protein L1987_03878 [Smallanthus sonchifolius]|uniref:Uncharacterized protein n=2 Tax=Smallanthus sonchifolius TaxID=185202 RepID=A0ACB9KBT9_9ASTR|nr:hypothetical protein L1987_03874 [Smallanthus sonchifolius]KAI3829750.1 hypothetical protein L1987_03878 [Smallanthus sonchifolius]
MMMMQVEDEDDVVEDEDDDVSLKFYEYLVSSRTSAIFSMSTQIQSNISAVLAMDNEIGHDSDDGDNDNGNNGGDSGSKGNDKEGDSGNKGDSEDLNYYL